MKKRKVIKIYVYQVLASRLTLMLPNISSSEIHTVLYSVQGQVNWRMSVRLEFVFCRMSQWQQWYVSQKSNLKYFNNVGLYLYKDLTAKSSSWSWPLFGLVRWARGKRRASTCLCPVPVNTTFGIESEDTVPDCTEYAASQLLGPIS